MYRFEFLVIGKSRECRETGFLRFLFLLLEHCELNLFGFSV